MTRKEGLNSMMYYTHVPAGVAAGLMYQAMVPNTNPLTFSISCAFGGLGAMIPDLDSKNSKISRKLPFLSAPICLITKWMNPNKKNLLHIRGITHELYFWVLMIVFPMVYCSVYPTFAITLFVGVLSHLLLDACNPSGIAFFAPITDKRTRFMKIKTGSGGEKVFSVFMYLLCIGFGLYNVVEMLASINA